MPARCALLDVLAQLGAAGELVIRFKDRGHTSFRLGRDGREPHPLPFHRLLARLRHVLFKRALPRRKKQRSPGWRRPQAALHCPAIAANTIADAVHGLADDLRVALRQLVKDQERVRVQLRQELNCIVCRSPLPLHLRRAPHRCRREQDRTLPPAGLAAHMEATALQLGQAHQRTRERSGNAECEPCVAHAHTRDRAAPLRKFAALRERVLVRPFHLKHHALVRLADHLRRHHIDPAMPARALNAAGEALHWPRSHVLDEALTRQPRCLDPKAHVGQRTPVLRTVALERLPVDRQLLAPPFGVRERDQVAPATTRLEPHARRYVDLVAHPNLVLAPLLRVVFLRPHRARGHEESVLRLLTFATARWWRLAALRRLRSHVRERRRDRPFNRLAHRVEPSGPVRVVPIRQPFGQASGIRHRAAHRPRRCCGLRDAGVLPCSRLGLGIVVGSEHDQRVRVGSPQRLADGGQVARVHRECSGPLGCQLHARSRGQPFGNEKHRSALGLTEPVPQPGLAGPLQQQLVGAAGGLVRQDALYVPDLAGRIAQRHEQLVVVAEQHTRHSLQPVAVEVRTRPGGAPDLAEFLRSLGSAFMSQLAGSALCPRSFSFCSTLRLCHFGRRRGNRHSLSQPLGRKMRRQVESGVLCHRHQRADAHPTSGLDAAPCGLGIGRAIPLTTL